MAKSQKIQKWGNSLALRIPQVLAEQAGLSEGTSVFVRLDAGKLVISASGGSTGSTTCSTRSLLKTGTTLSIGDRQSARNFGERKHLHAGARRSRMGFVRSPARS